MSPTYLYCLTAHAAPDPPAGTMGLDGEAVRRLGDAWVSDVASRSIRATVERIRAHDAVVSVALNTGSTPLPARFGQTFASDAECVEVISAKHEATSAGLARVAGMVEMTLLFRVEATALDASSGTAYLGSLARRQHTVESMRRASRELDARLGDCIRGSAQGGSENTVTLSHLVEREALAMYLERVKTLTNGLDVRVIGPGAPYSFAFAPPE